MNANSNVLPTIDQLSIQIDTFFYPEEILKNGAPSIVGNISKRAGFTQ